MSLKFLCITALQRADATLQALLRPRYVRRPVLESTHTRFDPCDHALRGSYFGLLAANSARER